MAIKRYKNKGVARLAIDQPNRIAYILNGQEAELEENEQIKNLIRAGHLIDMGAEPKEVKPAAKEATNPFRDAGKPAPKEVKPEPKKEDFPSLPTAFDSKKPAQKGGKQSYKDYKNKK